MMHTGTQSRSVEQLVARAKDGDAEALDALVRSIRDAVYNLAVRMLWHPADAEDAAQEILLKIVTNLSTFRGASAFRTWMFRVATNHLLNVQRSRVEQEALAFDRFGRDLKEGLADPPATTRDDPEQALLVEEVKIGCTQAMLLCLDRADRVAYILGDIFNLTGLEAARILGISAAAFRKRLSRSRGRLRAFMGEHCGLVNAEAACSCRRRLSSAIDHGRVVPARLLFAGRATTADPIVSPLHRPTEETREIDELHRIAGIFRSHPAYAAPGRLLDGVRRILESGRLRILAHDAPHRGSRERARRAIGRAYARTK